MRDHAEHWIRGRTFHPPDGAHALRSAAVGDARNCYHLARHRASVYLAGNPTLVNDLNSTGGGISGTASNGDNLYDALQATLQKRFSNGLQYQVAYTYSKCMTNSSGYYGSWGGQTTPTSPYWQNVYDMRAE